MTILEVDSGNAIRTVAQLAGEIWTEYYTAIIGADQVRYMLHKYQTEAAIAGQIREGMRYYLVTDERQAAIGYFAVQPQDGELFLSKLYLRREMRGRGWGRGMIQWTENLARALGCTSIGLTVNKHNESSIQAYQKMGFAVTDSIVTDIGSGFVMDDFRMQKAVSATEAGGI